MEARRRQSWLSNGTVCAQILPCRAVQWVKRWEDGVVERYQNFVNIQRTQTQRQDCFGNIQAAFRLRLLQRPTLRECSRATTLLRLVWAMVTTAPALWPERKLSLSSCFSAPVYSAGSTHSNCCVFLSDLSTVFCTVFEHGNILQSFGSSVWSELELLAGRAYPLAMSHLH